MKKFALCLAFVSLFSVYSFGQVNTTGKKGGKITTEQLSSEDRQTQNYLNQGRQGQVIAVESKDCQAEHLGTILFHNQSKKDLTLEVLDVKGEKICTVDVESKKSTYVKDIEMGEYYYKSTTVKKANKKKNRVNVIECTLKSIILDDKSLK